MVGGLQKEVLARLPFWNALNASFPHRNICPWLLLPTGRSRGQLDSYSAHPLPFLFLLCAVSGSAISMQLHYQYPLLIVWLQPPQGPHNFVALFLLLLA